MSSGAQDNEELAAPGTAAQAGREVTGALPAEQNWAAAADAPGDPVCWLRRVCPECGSFVVADPPTTCPQCHADLRDAHPDLPGDCYARWAARPGAGPAAAGLARRQRPARGAANARPGAPASVDDPHRCRHCCCGPG